MLFQPSNTDNTSLSCAVCMELPEKAMITTSCGHLFCENCIAEVLRRAQAEEEHPRCPECRKRFTSSGVHHCVRTQRAINNLPVQCASGCDWKGAKQDLIQHLKTCPESVIQCSNAECEEHVARKLLAHHLSVCPHTKVHCGYQDQGCTFYGKRKNLAKHERNCPKAIIYKCKNAGCDFKTKEDREFRCHKCWFELIACPIAGCGQKVKRSELAKHMLHSERKHLLCQVYALERKCKFLERENAKLRMRALGERCIVKMPIDNAGDDQTTSRTFTLFGDEWHLISDAENDHRSLFLCIRSSTKFRANFSFRILPHNACAAESDSSGDDDVGSDDSDDTVARAKARRQALRKAAVKRRVTYAADEYRRQWGFPDMIADRHLEEHIVNSSLYVEVQMFDPPTTV